MDAHPSGPPPRSIGRHARLIPLQSGDPAQVTRQELDAAIFEISDPSLVSSAHGGGYDTPSQIGALAGGQLVKKTGRTTGATHGRVVGEFIHAVPINYQSRHFTSRVYFSNVFGIVSKDDSPFSAPGDSGSVVVSEDEDRALGLLFGGSDKLALVAPLGSVLEAFDVTLVSQHNV
jgi:hypothetical protein